MPVPLDRDALKSMKRADLQRICKDYGIKANLKTEALIDLLIDTTTARPRPTPPVIQRAPSTRRVSRAVPSLSRPRGTSSSSVIIHDSDEEDSALQEQHRRSVAPTISSEPEAPPPPPRTRRAKETQYRLGVGRPTVVGGSGARAVTRSTSATTKAKRGKGSRSVKPVEAAIQEEDEPEPMESEMPEAGPSGTSHDHEHPSPPMQVPQQAPASPSPQMLPDIPEHVKKYITELVTPFQTQIQLLQAELLQRSTREADLHALTSQMQLIQAEVQSLRSQAAMVSQLQSEVHQLRQLVSDLLGKPVTDSPQPSAKSLGKVRALDEDGSQAAFAGSDPAHNTGNSPTQPEVPHGSSQPLLGKRQRGSEDSHITDVAEVEHDTQSNHDEQEKRAARPTKKKPKLAHGDQVDVRPGASASGQAQHPETEVHAPSRPPPAAFTIFSGPEEPPETYFDPPPPTTHLSDLFPGPPTIGGHTPAPNNGGGTIVRPIGADENAPNLGFNFSFNTSIFHPMTSTPYDMGNSSFVYPEPPASPSPGMPSGGFVERAGGRIERNDLYHPHGRRHAQSQAQADGESQSRPQSAASRPASRAAYSQATSSQPQLDASGNGTVDPTALISTPSGLSTVPEASQETASNSMLGGGNFSFGSQSRRVPSSSEIGMAFGMSSQVPLPPETPAPPMKRTMYGTELEGDTRFGDFGVEGVATGFWAGLAPRF